MPGGPMLVPSFSIHVSLHAGIRHRPPFSFSFSFSFARTRPACRMIRRRPLPHRLRAWLVPCAIALLLLAQTLALVHRHAHGHPAPEVVAVGAEGEAPDQADAGFGEHTPAECRLFDQPGVTPPGAVAPPAVTPLAVRLRAFLARGPPSLA
jgi:hypothetical protein